MKNIADFFGKFSKLKPTGRIIKKTAYIVFKKRNLPILEDEIIYHNKTLYLSASSIIKNEVFILKNDLVKEINIELGSTQVEDIR